MEVKNGQYTLKVMLTTEQNIETASAYKYSRIPSNYILLYTDEPVKGAIDMPDEGFSRLTNADVAWLRDCVVAVAIEKGVADKDKIRDNNLKFIRAFEKELQAEADKLSGKVEIEDAKRNETETTNP